MENQRNVILAVVLIAVVLFGWDTVVRHFYPQADAPRQERVDAARKDMSAPPASGAAQSGVKPTREGGLTDPADVALERQDLATALKAAGRVPIAAPGLSGSINLVGGVVDDLVTNRHTATVDKGSGPSRIFSPAGTPAQQYAQFGWVAGSNAGGAAAVAFPTASTVWTVSAGAKLTPQTPVTLTWTNPTGQSFAITYAIDADYMITAAQAVANRGAAPVAVRPFALINRTSHTASADSFNVHSGPIATLDGSVYFSLDYANVDEAAHGAPPGSWSPLSHRPGYAEQADAAPGVVDNPGHTDWLGFTDVYWMSALIPDPAGATSAFRAQGRGNYRADLIYKPMTLAPGQAVTRTTRLFAGAKEHDVLDRYEAAGIPNFGLAIDWGWFRWFEKPIFWLLLALFRTVGNFGLAIILLTCIVRGIMFPIAQRGFASMAAMRAIQPKMKVIQERYKDDKERQQREVMALYKAEKVNPVAGCLPMLLQIPVFFALYKTLMLAIEMRHQPFVLWIRDLSAPDPLHVLNLFGLLPFTPPSFLGIGVLALLLGTTMFLQFKLNPVAGDPVQQQMFSIMPWVMMFVMAPFAAGLLLYWITSNLLTIAQQKYLYSRHPQLRAQADQDAADKQRAVAKA